jgi:hypothetical protein
MDVHYNGSGIPQVFYNYFRDPVVLPPRYAYSFENLREVPKNFTRYSSLRPLIENAKKILFVRNYALGDTLMLLPVLREIKETYPDKKIYLATNFDLANNYYIKRFSKGIVEQLFTNYEDVSGYDLGVFLDYVVERDTHIKEYSVKHRVDIFRECLCLPTGTLPVWNTEPTWVGLHGVVLCSGGSNPRKQLTTDTANYFVKQIKKRKFRKFLHIREGNPINPPEILEALQNARVVITMDSAPLWLAHYTNTPTVLISGPSRGSERLTYHPLYPDGAKEVSCSKEIGCTPCFESNVECSRGAKCLVSIPKEKLWNMVEKVMEEVMWTN